MAAEFSFQAQGLPPLTSERRKIARFGRQIGSLVPPNAGNAPRHGFAKVKIDFYSPPASGLSDAVAIIGGIW